MRRLILLSCLLFIQKADAQIARFSNQTEIGVLTGESSYTNFSLKSFNGIRFREVPVETGLSIGLDSYSQLTLLPIGLSLGWNPLAKHDVSPYVRLEGGYGFDWLEHNTNGTDYSGGYFIQPSVGIRVRTPDRPKLVFSLGYKKQDATISSTPANYDTIGLSHQEISHYTFKRLYFAFGLSF